MKWLTIVGARPQFIKLGPVSRAIHAHAAGAEIHDLVVHTGQHFDDNMSEVFFRELALPRPAINLGIGGGGHGAQTGRMLEELEALMQKETPDIVIVYGDTNSTLAGALAAAKLHLPIAHIEAGLRSFNRAMPEEINRLVADHVSDLLLVPTPTGMKNLVAESLGDRSRLVGDVMYDAVLHTRAVAMQRSKIVADLALSGKSFGVVTIHRPENSDTELLGTLLAALSRVADENDIDLVFPVHPRTRQRMASTSPRSTPSRRLRLIEPLGHLDMMQLVASAKVVLTDSGGLQKEAFFLGVPCVTLRSETEWVETVEAGANVVVGADAQRIRQAAATALDKGASWSQTTVARYFGDGDAGARIVAEISEFAARKAAPRSSNSALGMVQK
jgi:UDP-N-acetylglucosamine 2-epimerase